MSQLAGREWIIKPRSSFPGSQIRAADAAALEPDPHLALRWLGHINQRYLYMIWTSNNRCPHFSSFDHESLVQQFRFDFSDLAARRSFGFNQRVFRTLQLALIHLLRSSIRRRYQRFAKVPIHGDGRARARFL